MATINLGSIKFNWQGAYNGATAYSVDDVVSYNGSSYICKLASTGNLPTNTTYFDQMSSAGTNGTNGTDLTTTLTTQGDIVYRDGSGLQRLGAGTAGQVLQTGGAGANPSWGNISSGELQFIDSYTLTADTSQWNFDSVFDSNTYDHYKINVYNLAQTTTGNLDKYFALRSGGSMLSANIFGGRIRNTPDSNGFTTGTQTDNWQRIEHSGTRGGASYLSSNYEILLYNAHGKLSDGTSASHRPQTMIKYVGVYDNAIEIAMGFAHAVWNTTSSADGFALKSSSVDLRGANKPKVDLFGVIKQS